MKLTQMAVGAACLAALTFGIASPASASSSPDAARSTAVAPDGVGPIAYKFVVSNIKTTNNYTKRSVVLAKCINPGGTCQIKSEASHATTIGLALGATVNNVAPSLKFDTSDTNSTGVTCTTPRKLTASEVYEAFAVGVRKTYVIKKEVAATGTVMATSGTLSSFDPYTYPAISCLILSQ